MSDDPQEDQVPDEEVTPAEEAVPTEESVPAEEAVSEEEAEEKPETPKAEDADDDDVPFSVENLRAEIDEIGSRAKSAGLNPLRRMLTSYAEQTLDAVDGLLSALEGKGTKRKKGD
jgi:hypothetical protein